MDMETAENYQTHITCIVLFIILVIGSIITKNVMAAIGWFNALMWVHSAMRAEIRADEASKKKTRKRKTELEQILEEYKPKKRRLKIVKDEKGESHIRFTED